MGLGGGVTWATQTTHLCGEDVRVGATAGDHNSATSTACGVHNLTAPSTEGPFAFHCGALTGEYLTLVLPGPSRILNLGEVFVYSPFFSPSPPRNWVIFVVWRSSPSARVFAMEMFMKNVSAMRRRMAGCEGWAILV